MSREIKFRVWDKKYYKMYSDQGIRMALACPNEEVEIMQYTGLKDKKGKEIYEGDIDCRGRVVIWSKRACKFAFREKYITYYKTTRLYSIAKCTIAGNIYENPELIKE